MQNLKTGSRRLLDIAQCFIHHRTTPLAPGVYPLVVVYENKNGVRGVGLNVSVAIRVLAKIGFNLAVGLAIQTPYFRAGHSVTISEHESP